MLGVTGRGPTRVAHDAAEYTSKLRDFADSQGARHGVAIDAVELESVDVAAELPKVLEHEAERRGYDLIVMASHAPGLLDHLFTSNAGHVASFSSRSVFVVRG